MSGLIEKALTDKTALPNLEEVRRRIHSGIGAADMPTVADWLHDWLPTQHHLSANTRRSYESHIRLYLAPTIGHHRIDRLRVPHLGDMIEAIDEFNDRIGEYRASSDPALRALARYRRPVGPTSLHRIRATLRAALNDAMRQELITLNPAALLKLPPPGKARPVVWTDEHVDYWRRTGKTPSPVMVWTPEQTGQFLDHAVHDRLYALYHLVALTGLRRGEACGLHWHDLNLHAGTLTVRHQILQLGCETQLAPPKTDDSTATIAISDDTITSLNAHRMLQQAEAALAADTWHDTGLVFTEPDGQALHPAHVTAHFRHLQRQANLPPVRLHDLRHGAATHALDAGIDMKHVQTMLRHTSIKTTSDTYTNVLPRGARNTANTITRAIPRNT